ncbi:hypothetical protein ACP70R_014753 [Stipagrostis hirtigluma subsp. patula]
MGSRFRQSYTGLALGPLQYEPMVFCKRRMKAARWISWRDENPCCRYLMCWCRGCKFCRWYDNDKPSEVVCTLIMYLRDTVKNPRREKNELRSAIDDAMNKLEEERSGNAVAVRMAVTEKEAETIGWRRGDSC